MNRRLKQALLRVTLPKPMAARHSEYSMVFSMDDEPSKPSRRLLDVALETIAAAKELRLDALCARIPESVHINLWPGEQYRLLAALVQVMRPALVVEVGTGGGSSALSMLHTLPRDGKVVTFDVVPWQRLSRSECALDDADFQNGRLTQHTDDVSHPEGFAKHRALFERANLFVLDAAKDGRMEARLLDLLRRCSFHAAPVFVFDDIRFWNMLAIWRTLPWPKLDLTSFGHWTGTGLAEWTPAATSVTLMGT